MKTVHELPNVDCTSSSSDPTPILLVSIKFRISKNSNIFPIFNSPQSKIIFMLMPLMWWGMQMVFWTSFTVTATLIERDIIPSLSVTGKTQLIQHPQCSIFQHSFYLFQAVFGIYFIVALLSYDAMEKMIRENDEGDSPKPPEPTVV